MADSDILYGFLTPSPEGGYIAVNEHEAQESLRQIMENLQYHTVSLKGVHDTYKKPPLFNFEMHRGIVAETSPFYEYYRNPWERAVQNAKDSNLYEMSPEDEYIYQIVHTYKHFYGTGCGIRFLTDVYVFWKKHGETLDLAYVGEELEKLKLRKFEQNLRRLAEATFGTSEALSREDEEQVLFFLGCGVYGNVETRTHQRLEKLAEEKPRGVKLRYVWNRLFLSDEVVKVSFPTFYRHPILRIFLPAYRVISAVILRPSVVRGELRALRRKKTK